MARRIPQGTQQSRNRQAVSGLPLPPSLFQVLPLNDVVVTLPRRRALEHVRVEELAKKRNISMAQIGLAWTLTKEGSLDFSVSVQPCSIGLLLGIRAHALTYFCSEHSRHCSHHRHYVPR